MDGSPDNSRRTPITGVQLGLALAVAAAFGVGLFSAGKHGFGALYLWSVLFALGTGLALALFWGRRSAAWYWPTATLLIAAHVFVLAAFKWQMFSRASTQFGSGTMLKGAIGADFAIDMLVLYIVHGFFDPEAVAKTGPLAAAKAIKLGFAILALTIPAAITILVIQRTAAQIRPNSEAASAPHPSSAPPARPPPTGR